MPAPDLRFDIDALFSHLAHLGLADEEREWSFDFRAPKVGVLARLADELEPHFPVHLQEEVETIEGDRRFMGPPMLSVIIVGAFPKEEIKQLHARFTALARERGVAYEGVSSSEPMEEEDFDDWLELDEAKWRLRAFSDSGLDQDASITYVFGIIAENPRSLKSVAAALRKAGFEDVEHIEDDDEPYILVQTQGANSEAVLAKQYAKVESAVNAAKADLLGVQFVFADEAPDEEE